MRVAVRAVCDGVTVDSVMVLVMSNSQDSGVWFLVEERTDVTEAWDAAATKANEALQVGVRVSAWADGDSI